jgi:hypothetical protein
MAEHYKELQLKRKTLFAFDARERAKKLITTDPITITMTSGLGIFSTKK